MNTHRDDRDTNRRDRRFSHAGNAVGLRGELTDGLRRRIMAALRLSSLYVAFGRRSKLGALGAGAVTATFGMVGLLAPGQAFAVGGVYINDQQDVGCVFLGDSVATPAAGTPFFGGTWGGGCNPGYSTQTTETVFFRR